MDTTWRNPANPFALVTGISANEMRRWHDLLLSDMEAPSAAVSGSEVCECGGHLQKQSSSDTSICSDCGLISTVCVEAPPRPVMLPLVLVGSDRQKFQPNMYRSGSGPSDEHKRKTIAMSYTELFDRYIESQGAIKRDLPRDAIPLAADIYGIVQEYYVKRSVNRKRIMGRCLEIAFFKIGYASSSKEIAAVMQLPEKGRLSGGTNFLWDMVSCGKMSLDLINISPEEKLACIINTLFSRIGYGEEAYQDLRDAVKEIYEIAVDKDIGVASMMNSKVNGATFAVLHRAVSVADPPTIETFCLDTTTETRIRNKTVTNFLDELKRYHTHFEPTYVKFRLRAAKDLPSAAPVGRKKKTST